MNFKLLKRKEQIIISAIDILNKKGYKGLTIKEIAKSQKITEPAIYRQFNSKKEIVSAIIDRLGKHDLMIQETLMNKNCSLLEGIEFYMQSYASIYENYPQLITIYFTYDLFKYDNITMEKIQKVFKKRKEFLSDYFISKGIPKMKSECLQETIHDKIFSAIYKWDLGLTKEELSEQFECFLDKLSVNYKL